MTYGVNWKAIDRAVGSPMARPSHPGEVLADLLDEQGWGSRQELADKMDVTPAYISGLVGCHKNIGTRTALKLAQGTGVKAEVWLHLQMAWNLAQERTR